MRNPAFCICKNKGVDQLCGNLSGAADQLCFCYIVQSLYFLNLKFQASRHLLWRLAQFVSDLVGNPEGLFSCDAAHNDFPHIQKLILQSYFTSFRSRAFLYGLWELAEFG